MPREPAWFVALACGLTVAASVIGAIAWGRLGGLAALAAVVGPSTIASLLNRRDQRRAVVAAVTEQSAAMSAPELRRLVKALEWEWSRRDMRPLRDLLPPDLDPA